jgi:hypothetical protein
MGQPVFAAFHVDTKHGSVKAFGKHVASVAKRTGGPKYLAYTPVEGRGPKGVVYIWFPDGAEGGSVGKGSDQDKATLAEHAKKAKGAFKAFGKTKLQRVAEHGRKPGSPAPYVVALGVKVDPAKAKAVKSALKNLHQTAITKTSARYSAHKVGDGHHGVVLAGLNSLEELKSSPLHQRHGAVTAEHEKSLKDALSGAIKGHHKQVLKYLPEYSNP